MPLEEKKPVKKMFGAIKKKHEEIKSKIIKKPVKKAEPKKIAKKAAVKKPVKKIVVKKPVKKPVAKPSKPVNKKKVHSTISSILGKFRR